jgi:hypothetical protein
MSPFNSFLEENIRRVTQFMNAIVVSGEGGDLVGR